MYVVIVGGGRIGLAIARWLVEADHEVAVIDRDGSRCAAIDEQLGSLSVLGDATEASVLARAGTNRADVFIAATGNDAENMLACQFAKHRFDTANILSIVNVPGHDKLFRLLGINNAVSTTDLAVGKLREVTSDLLTEESREET